MAVFAGVSNKMVKLSHYLNGKFNLPELMGNHLICRPDEFRIVGLTNLHTCRTVMDNIQPYQLRFLWSQKDVRKAMGKPLYTVNDDVYMPDHEMWVYKRFIGDYKTTTQLSFIRGKLRVVYEELKKGLHDRENHFPEVLSKMGIQCGAYPAELQGCCYFRDAKGNHVFVEEDINIRIRIQNGEI